MSYILRRWSLMGATAFVFSLSGTLPILAQPRKTAARAVATITSVAPMPESSLSRAELEAHLRFLASDELQGRRTGSAGNRVAARYIAGQFRLLGLKPVPALATGADAAAEPYFQRVNLQRTQPVTTGSLRFGADSVRVGAQFAVLAGKATTLTAPGVYVGYGLSPEDYAGKDVTGKFVITQVGSAEAKTDRKSVV